MRFDPKILATRLLIAAFIILVTLGSSYVGLVPAFESAENVMRFCFAVFATAVAIDFDAYRRSKDKN